MWIWNPGGPIDLFYMFKSKLETSWKIAKTTKTSCYTFAILTKKFWSPILELTGVLGKSDPLKPNLLIFLWSENFSMFFEFLKVLKNHTGFYRLTGQAIFHLMAFWKKLKKSEKYRKNFWIVKIHSDSVSVGPIYLSHLKNPISVRCQVQTFWNDTFEKFCALKNL